MTAGGIVDLTDFGEGIGIEDVEAIAAQDINLPIVGIDVEVVPIAIAADGDGFEKFVWPGSVIGESG